MCRTAYLEHASIFWVRYSRFSSWSFFVDVFFFVLCLFVCLFCFYFHKCSVSKLYAASLFQHSHLFRFLLCFCLGALLWCLFFSESLWNKISGVFKALIFPFVFLFVPVFPTSKWLAPVSSVCPLYIQQIWQLLMWLNFI